MPAVRHGAQWASRARSLPLIAAMVIAVSALGVLVPTRASAATGDYLLMPRAELLSLPTSGTAWTELKKVADGSLGSPDLCDQNSQHHLRTLAAALVYARTGTASYGTKARAGVMAAIATQKVGCGNAVLALGRQLVGYVLAADFAELSGSDDTKFRSWLSAIRTKDIGGHSTWYSLSETQRISANNWGAHAGASRIAASLYLGDTYDVSIAARIAQGFLGNRTSYSSFSHTLESEDLSWSCDGQSQFTPVNRPCTKNGIDLDGAIVADISRAGSLKWPPGDTGISYQVDSVAAMAMQVELLYRHGYPTAWGWSNDALRRAAQIVQRSDRDGGDGWNMSSASSQIPWLLNKRYGAFLPTEHVPMGRGIGFADWLWGAGTGITLDPPTATTPWVRLSTTSSVPSSGQPVVVGWGLAKTADGLNRYELQTQTDGGTWKAVKLSYKTATIAWLNVSTSHLHAFRVRAIDRSGRVGPWATSATQSTWKVADDSAYLRWSGTWTIKSKSSYLEGSLHASTVAKSDVSLSFNGASVAWVSPVGPDLGQGHVYLDGKYATTVDLRSSSSSSRKIVYAANLSNGVHTIRVIVVGTSGRPQVDIDGFYVLRPR